MRHDLLFSVLLILGLASSGAACAEPTAGFGPDARVALGAYRGMVEAHVAGIRRTLRTVAASSEARSGAWQQVQPMLAVLADDLSTDAATWFAQPDGSYFIVGSEAPAAQNLGDRHYFPALMAGKEVFGDLVISKSTGHRSVIVAVPVLAGGRIVGAVGVSLRVRLLSQLVDEALRLPPEAYFYALEGDTRIVLHRRAERMFQTPADVGDEALGEEFERVLDKGKTGTFDYSLGGRQIRSIFDFSPTLGWYFFLAKPQ